MITETYPYEEWLTTIVNTRLIYSTMAELEDMLDNHSLHNNSIRRCFTSLPKQRAAYRDLKVEVELLTDNEVNLDYLLKRYKEAWIFFRDHFLRRSNPKQLAWELLHFAYPPCNENLPSKRLEVFKKACQTNIDIPFLLLMLLKAVPGYDSKDGDAKDFLLRYDEVMQLLEDFTSQNTLLPDLPALAVAREAKPKSRLMLWYQLTKVLRVYTSFWNSEGLYNTSANLKQHMVDLDIGGFWNECDGGLDHTSFWLIRKAIQPGSYFATHWHKDANNRLTGISYTLYNMETSDGGMLFYVLHPLSIRHRMEGLAYADIDHAWYKLSVSDENQPKVMQLERQLPSTHWPAGWKLTRVTDEKVLDLYERWMTKECILENPYKEWEYTFLPNLYAVTQHHLYVPTGNEGEYYQIPKAKIEGSERMQLGDSVGIMLMNGQQYLVLDELLLYIPIVPEALERYGIRMVSKLE